LNITVFLADDHAVVREGLRLLLEMQPDIRVVGEAENGRDALRQVTTLRPDIVIMDISMPELNGIESTRQILNQCPSTKIVVLSMHSASEHVFRALGAGAKGYLLKESAGVEVTKAVRTVHKGGRYLSQKISDMVIDDYLGKNGGDNSGSPFARLSAREIEIFQLVVEGKSSADIAKTVFLSPKTIETYRSRLMQKLNVKDIPGLVKLAIKHGLVSLE
jgi:DNA-binding NarL/FixJ family response regulator